ncbi:MAG: hypothetical protein ACYSSN_06980 [Planctomycetota bacterium]
MCKYSWRVPDNIEINNQEEVFKIKVTFDTRGLYGKVTGTRSFTINRASGIFPGQRDDVMEIPMQ